MSFRILLACSFLANVYLDYSVALAGDVQKKGVNNRIEKVSSCPAGSHILQQPEGPFVAVLSCEDALGTYLAIAYFDSLGSPAVGSWSLMDRFWQDATWGSDVHTISWVNKGKGLVVSTSGTYGEAGVYLLDLYGRKFKKLFPPENSMRSKNYESRYSLKKIDSKQNKIVFEKIDRKNRAETISVSF